VPLTPVILIQSIVVFLAGSPLTVAFLVLLALGFWPTCRLAISAARARTWRRRAALALASVVFAVMTFVLSLIAWGGLFWITGFPLALAVLVTGATGGLVLSCVALGELRRSRRTAAA